MLFVEHSWLSQLAAIFQQHDLKVLDDFRIRLDRSPTSTDNYLRKSATDNSWMNNLEESGQIITGGEKTSRGR